jgi:hypothetical protein
MGTLIFAVIELQVLSDDTPNGGFATTRRSPHIFRGGLAVELAGNGQFFFEFRPKHRHYARSLDGGGHRPPLHWLLNLK